MKSRYGISGQGLISGFSHLVILVLLAMAAVALCAPLRNGYQLRQDLEAARRRLGELEVLYPLYAELVAMDQPARWPGLDASPRQKLTEPEVVSVPERFRNIADACEVELGAVSPQVEKTEAGEPCLRVDIRANGTYGQLKDFLMGMASLPELVCIEKIEVNREDRKEQFHIIAQLALE